MKYLVYAHVNVYNEKIYIGITSKNAEERWGYKGNKYKDIYAIGKAFKKYGWENFDHIILCENLTKEDACKMEKDLIALYSSNDRRFGYNLTDGGESTSLCPESKAKMIDNMPKREVAKFDYRTGAYIESYRSVKEASRKNNISDANVIRLCKNIESYRQIKNCIYKYTEDLNYDYTCGLSEFDLSKYINQTERKVICYNLKGYREKVFPSVKEASVFINSSEKNLWHVITGNHYHKGYIWLYEDSACALDVLDSDFLNSVTYRGRSIFEIGSIYQFDKDGNILNVFKDLKEACEYMSLILDKSYKSVRSIIQSCCARRQLTAFGYVWKFAKDCE